MATVCVVHRSDAALDREAAVSLARALQAAGLRVLSSWTQPGVTGGELAGFESMLEAADQVLLVDPLSWWSRGPSGDPWQACLRARLDCCERIGLEGFSIVERGRASVPVAAPLAQLPRLQLPEQWSQLLEQLARARPGPGPALFDASSPELPRCYVPTPQLEPLLAVLDAAVHAAEAGGGGLVWIRGAPGSGKSVLLAAWLARRAAAGQACRCLVPRPGIEWSRAPTRGLAAVAESLGAGQHDEPWVVALDGLERLAAPDQAWDRGLGPHCELALRGLVLVVASRPLASGSIEASPVIDLDLDRELAGVAQAQIVQGMIEGAELGPWAEVIASAAEGNPGVARALIDARTHTPGPGPGPAPGLAPPLPRALELMYERSWTRTLARSGDRRALLSGLALLRVVEQPLPPALVEATLTPAERAAVLELAREWLRVTGEGLSLAHSYARRFLDAELDVHDPSSDLRVLLAIERLRKHGQLDAGAAAYAERREVEHRFGAAGFGAHAGWLGELDQLQLLAGHGQLEPRLQALVAGVDEVAPLAVPLLAMVRRHAGELQREPGRLPGRLWTALVGEGMSPTVALQTFSWGASTPRLRLRHALPIVDRCDRALASPDQEEVRHCAIDAAGARAITASTRHVQLWSVPAAQLLASFETPNWIGACAITPDGRHAVIAHGERVSWWDLDTRCEVDGHDDHGDRIRAVALSADGRVVISGDSEGGVIMWRRFDRKRHRLGAHRDGVLGCAVTPGGDLGMTCGDDNLVMVWDLDGCTRLHTLKGHRYRVGGVALTSAGARAVSIGIGDAFVWDPRTGEQIASYPALGSSTNNCVIVNDDTEVLTNDGGRCALRWKLADGSIVDRHVAHAQDINALAATPDGACYLTGGDDRITRIWQREAVEGPPLAGSVREVVALHPSADQRGFWISVSGRPTRLLGLDGSERASLDGTMSSQGICGLGDRVALVGSNKKVEIYELGRDSAVASWQPGDEWLRACAVDAQGQRLAYAGDDQKVFVSTLEGKQLRRVGGHDAWIYALAWHPDGRLLSLDRRGQLRVWEPDLRDLALSWDSTRSPRPRCMALDVDSDRVFIGGATIEALELGSGRVCARFEGHVGSVTDLALAEDERVLVSVGDDASLRVWDCERETELARCEAPFALSRVIVVGRTIVAGDAVGNHLVFDVDWDRLFLGP